MNNSIIQSLALAWQNTKVRVVAIIALLLIVVFVGITLLFFTAPKLTAVNTRLTSDMPMDLVKGKLAVYNGNSFYTIDPFTKSTPEVLYTPKYRFPTISSYVWSKSGGGILLNFQSGIMYSPIANATTSSGMNQYGTWYLNFSDGTLTAVDTSDLRADMAFYSSQQNGFYYVPNTPDAPRQSLLVNTLKYYDVQTKKTRLISDNLSLTVNAIVPCALGEEPVCIIGRKPSEKYGKASLFSVSKTGSLKVVKSYDGELYQTPDPNKYIALLDGKPKDEIETVYSKIALFDTSTGKEVSYSGNVIGGKVAVGQANGSFYLFDGQNNEYTVITPSGSSHLGLLEFGKASGIVLMNNKTSSELMLVSSTDKNIYAVGEKSQPQPYVVSDASGVEKTVTNCLTQSGSTMDRNGTGITVYINDNDNFLKNLSAIKTCIASDVKNLYGYTFTYRGISEFNGRITTD